MNQPDVLGGPGAVAAQRVASACAVEVLTGVVALRCARLRCSGARAGEACPGSQGVVVLLDGLTGSGKTTLACALVQALAENVELNGPRVLTVEELVPGWDGLAEGVARCSEILAALGRGEPGSAERWDWERMVPGGRIVVPPLHGSVLVVEGCGALAAAAHDLPGMDVLRVLIQAPDELRHGRLAERDAYAWDVDAWERQERELARRWIGTRWGPEMVVSHAS